MRRLVAALLACAPLYAQPETVRHPAGKDAQGAPLVVIEKRHGEDSDAKGRCAPKNEYLLQASKPQPLVTLCQTEDQAEITVTVKPNTLEVNREGGTQAGYSMSQTYQLAPWRAVRAEACSFLGSQRFTYERWDLRALRGQAWAGTVDEADDSLCVPHPKLFTYLMVPEVTAAAERLGSCSLKLDASGKNGFVLWGKPDPSDPVEIRLLWTGPQTLVAQVVDPNRSTKPSASWINADHFEVWMGTRSEDAADSMWQFGIPVDEGPVQVGYGKPPRLPGVRRSKAALPGGRTATVLTIELPPPAERYANGITIVYSQSLDGRAQKRLIATSRVKRGAPMTLGVKGSALDRNSTGEYVVCAPVNGMLDIVDGPRRPVEVPPRPTP